MSRRPPALPIVAVLSLLTAGLLVPLLAPPAAAYGEHVFQANPVVGPGDPYYSVYSGATLAQSFPVNETFVLLNTTLRVRNAGSPMNALVVSIHPDDPVRHVPVMSRILAYTSQTTPNNNAMPVNWSFVFNPGPVLDAGATYWIVAQNGASQPSNGYEWHHSNADTYPGGVAAWLDPVSGTWTLLPYDLFFINYGRTYGAKVSLAMTANKAQAQPADFVTFTLYFNNSGNQSATRVWVNDTMPAGLGNVSTAYGGITSSTPYPNYTFANVPNGPHSFSITAQVAIGVTPGTVLTNTATLAYVNATGAAVGGLSAQASVRIGLVSKQLYLAPASTPLKLLTTAKPVALSPVTLPTLNKGGSVDLVQAPALARPLHLEKVNATLYLASQGGKSLLLNVTVLDRNGTSTSAIATTQRTVTPTVPPTYQAFLFSFPPIDYVLAPGHQVQLHIVNEPSSPDNAIVAVNATSTPSHLDLATPTYVSIDTLTLMNQAGVVGTWSPLDPLRVEANVSDPFGSGKITGVWINITAPSGGLAAAGALNLRMTDPVMPSAWKLYNFTLAPPLSPGRYRVDILAMEDNGVQARAEAWASVTVPQFELAQVASVLRARAGASFSFSLYYNNTGSGPAGRVWLNDTLPRQLTFVASTVNCTTQNGSRFGWVLPSVPVGPHRLEITVAVAANATSTLWVRNNATLAFTDTSGHLLPPLDAYADVLLNGPVVSLNLSSSPSSTVRSNETVVYTLGLQNTGDLAGDLWVNDTLPQGLTYVSDTAGPLGGTPSFSGSEVDFHFVDLPPGTTWWFQLVAVADPILQRNATYTDLVTVAYTSADGQVMPPLQKSVSLRAVSPFISAASVTFLVAQAGPGETVPVVLQFENAGNEPAAFVWINLTVDMNLQLADASLPASVGLGTVAFVLTGMTLGPHEVFMNFTVNDSVRDLAQLGILGTIEYQDASGGSFFPVTLGAAELRVAAPSMSLTVSPGNAVIEAGNRVRFDLSPRNAGTGTAMEVWLNLTLPDEFTFASDTSGSTVNITGNTLTWHWSNQTLGTHAFSLFLDVRPATLNGATSNLTFHVDYQTASNVQRLGVDSVVHIIVVAPTILLSIQADVSNPRPGATMVFTLRVQNAGLATAHDVWLVDAVDPRLQIITYESEVRATGTQTLNWTLQNLAPGMSKTINLTVRVDSDVPPQTLISAVIEATFTNSAGVVLGYARATPTTLQVSSDLMPLVWILGVGSILGAGLVLLVYRKSHVEIEEAFLVYRDGVLISHLSRTLMREKDEDVLSGMLTAVQEFVREAFQYGEHRELHRLDFGDYRILIERGKYVYLAVVYSGRESAQIHKKVRAVITRIETEYGGALEKWDGDMEEVVGARDLIRAELLGSNGRNHEPRTIPQYE